MRSEKGSNKRDSFSWKKQQNNKEEHRCNKEVCMYVKMLVVSKKSIEDDSSPLFFEFLYQRNRSQRRTRWLPSTCEGETRNARKVGSYVLPTQFPGRRVVRARRNRLKRQNVETNLRLVRCPNEAIWKERTWCCFSSWTATFSLTV